MPLPGRLTAAIRGGVLLIGDDRVLEDGRGDDGPHPLVGMGPADLRIRLHVRWLRLVAESPSPSSGGSR